MTPAQKRKVAALVIAAPYLLVIVPVCLSILLVQGVKSWARICSDVILKD